jgi:hypothetical protein
MKKDTYIIVKDRHPHVSEVLWDCKGQLCIAASKNESLTSILMKLCTKITNLQSQITALQDTVAELEERVEILETPT